LFYIAAIASLLTTFALEKDNAKFDILDMISIMGGTFCILIMIVYPILVKICMNIEKSKQTEKKYNNWYLIALLILISLLGIFSSWKDIKNVIDVI